MVTNILKWEWISISRMVINDNNSQYQNISDSLIVIEWTYNNYYCYHSEKTFKKLLTTDISCTILSLSEQDSTLKTTPKKVEKNFKKFLTTHLSCSMMFL